MSDFYNWKRLDPRAPDRTAILRSFRDQVPGHNCMIMSSSRAVNIYEINLALPLKHDEKKIELKQGQGLILELQWH